MSAPVPEVDAGLVEVLAAHHRGDWSDHTFSCRGCVNQAEAAWEVAPRDEWDEHRAAYMRAAKPGWSLVDYHQHLARAVQGYVEGRVAAGVVEALGGAAESVDVASDRLRLDPKVQAGMLRASRIVRSQATSGGERGNA